MICIPIMAETMDAALAMIREAAPLADLIELRIDGMRKVDLSRLLKDRPRPVIVTNRSRKEGGAFKGTEAERTALLAEAARLGAEYLDVETATAPLLKKELRRLCDQSGTRRIASWHDFSGTPSAAALEAKLAACMADGPEIVKLVTQAEAEADNLRLLSLIPMARKEGQAIIAFCMGDQGRISRVMAPLFGSRISYAPLAEEKASAPGQLTAGRMRELLGLLADLAPAENGLIDTLPQGQTLMTPTCEHTNGGCHAGLDPASRPVPDFRFHGNDSMALLGCRSHKPDSPCTKADTDRAFAVFGNPVSQSLSPLMHRTAFAHLGCPATYEAYRVDGAAGIIETIHRLDLAGASVTIPFKETVMPLLDRIDPAAEAIGAVNTICRRNGRLIGYNTDGIGLIRDLEAWTTLPEKRIVILGAGGAARAAVFGLMKAGAIPIVVNRTEGRARELAERFGCPWAAWEEIGTVAAEGLINTTPVGMVPKPESSPLPAEVTARFSWVMDMIYNPVETRLLKDAAAAGRAVRSGVGMFVHQGAEQIRLWLGCEPPLEWMEKAVRERLTGHAGD